MIKAHGAETEVKSKESGGFRVDFNYQFDKKNFLCSRIFNEHRNQPALQNKMHKPIKEVITNLNELKIKIVRFFGNTACQMYGLIQKSPVEILGM